MTNKKGFTEANSGQIEIDNTNLTAAKLFAKKYYEIQEEKDFSDDEVQSFDEKETSINIEPLKNNIEKSLFDIGFSIVKDEDLPILATIGVDSHDDCINGLTVCLVLHNDGLTFKQGKLSITPDAGDWFIFDDAKLHKVDSTKKSTALVCCTFPVRKMKEV